MTEINHRVQCHHQFQCHPLFQWVQWIQCESHGITVLHTHGTNTRVHLENSAQNTPEIPWDFGGVSNEFLEREWGEGAVSVCIGDPMGSHGLRYFACRVRVDGMLLILSCAVPHFTVTGFYASVSGFQHHSSMICL